MIISVLQQGRKSHVILGGSKNISHELLFLGFHLFHFWVLVLYSVIPLQMHNFVLTLAQEFPIHIFIKPKWMHLSWAFFPILVIHCLKSVYILNNCTFVATDLKLHITVVFATRTSEWDGFVRLVLCCVCIHVHVLHFPLTVQLPVQAFQLLGDPNIILMVLNVSACGKNSVPSSQPLFFVLFALLTLIFVKWINWVETE